MPKYFLFMTVTGSYAFDEKFRLAEKGGLKMLSEKYGHEKATDSQAKQVLQAFKRSEYYSAFRKANIGATKQKIRDYVNKDLLIVQSINAIDDIDRSANSIAKRLREWYELYCPEISRAIDGHEKFAEIIAKKPRKQLLAELHIEEDESMGGHLDKGDIDALLDLAKKVKELFMYKGRIQDYLESSMKGYCPNLGEIAGFQLGARLLAHAGTLKRLAAMPSSTVQLLGAEKALFRHIKTGARSPKHGIIVNHPVIAKSKPKDHGRFARIIADKISMAARIDYFHGKKASTALKQEIVAKTGVEF